MGGLRKIVLWTSPHGATALFEADGAADPFFNVNMPSHMTQAQVISGEAS